jgi:DNA-binding SARP family transcriptional activator
MRYGVLGTTEIINDDGAAIELLPRHLRALLTVLLVNANKAISADRISLHLWGDNPPARDIHAVHAYISALRRILLPGISLTSMRPGYRLDVGPTDCDLHIFRQLTAEGTKAAREARLTDAAALLHQAYSLWRDPSLPDFPHSPLMDREAARFLDEFHSARDLLIDIRLAIGDTQGLTSELLAQVSDAPGNERTWIRLMVSQYRSGLRVAALGTYLTARGQLAEYGIRPGPELSQVHRYILDDDPALHNPGLLLGLG